MKIAGVVGLVTGVVSMSALAQVVVKSPEVEAKKEQQLASPMVLEFPIPDVLLNLARPGSPKPPTTRVPMPDFGNYVCMNVKIKSLTLTAKAPTKKGLIDLRGDLVLSTSAGGDRLVLFELVVVAGGKAIARNRIPGIDAEEKKIVHKRLSLDLYAATLTADPPPKFRITMDVRDNT